MTPQSLKQDVLRKLRTYWRIRAGLAFHLQLATTHNWANPAVSYDSIPAFGHASNFMSNEPLQDTISEIAVYASGDRLATDTMLSMIASLEEFLSAFLRSNGASASGTFGSLQHAAQRIRSITPNLIHRVDELRERRNSIIHQSGAPTNKHSTAAQLVLNQGIGAPILVGATHLYPESTYLSYSCDTIICYAAAF